MGIRYIQPQTPVEIDWSNPLVQALGLVDVWIPSTGILTPTLIRKFTPVVSVGNFSLGVNASGNSLKYSAVTANNGLIIANDADELFPVANTASIFVIRQSLDTTARQSSLFGYRVGSSFNDRVDAQVPWSDGNIYFDFGGISSPNSLGVSSGGKTTKKEAYTFIAGPTKGREIWRNGIKLAGNASLTGARATTSGSFRIGAIGNNTGDASDLEGVNLFIIGSKEWPDWAIKSLSDNPQQIFKSQSRRIFVASAGGAAALAGNAAAQASASAAATTAIPITAAALSIASASSTLSTAIPLAGVAASQATAAANLTAGSGLSANAQAASSASAALSTAIPLSGAAASVASSNGSLTAQISLSASAQGSATASASLTAGSSGLSADAQATATASASLTAQIRLSAAAVSQSIATADLTAGAIPFTANALSIASASGALTTSINLAAGAVAVASATATLFEQTTGRLGGFEYGSKVYIKRNKKIYIFDSVEEADSYIEAESKVEEIVQQSNKTSRLARKRAREKAHKLLSIEPVETVDIPALKTLVSQLQTDFELPQWIARQDWQRVVEIYNQAMEMQDEEDLLLIL